ncbi:MAG: hypothetical protein HZB33_04020 [Nitrospirae bacterium]|nr:hypothetical protein [Nitrospirota bacterium]
MRKILRITGIFLSGVFVGAILMNLLHMYVRPAYRELIRTEIQTEQQFMASRATRQNDKLKAALHRWNVVEMDSGEGFRDLRHERIEGQDSFLLPFVLVPFKHVDSYYKNHEGSLKETRRFIFSLMEREKSDLHMQAEKKILGKNKKEAQYNRGDSD